MPKGPQQQEARTPPRVTIGVPVYNGEAFLAEALQSLLDQTFTDFEIIISDNASCDGTEAICRDFAKRDPRIRYVRQPRNLGAAPNFNLIVPMAQGEYFKWAACDDLHTPTFLEKCVAGLDQNIEASLCCTQTVEIAKDGTPLQVVDPVARFASSSVVKRFNAFLPMRMCYEVFGLIRLETLRKTDLIVGASHGDGILLCALGALGPFVILPEALFMSRKHGGQSINLSHDRVSYAGWFDAKNEGKLTFPAWRLLTEYSKISLRTPMSARDRAMCVRSLAQLLWAWRHGLSSDLVRGAARLYGSSRNPLTGKQDHA